MPDPLVSVIVASFNHQPFVDACIRSVLDQSLEDFEIVVTDDGSSDGTYEQLSRIDDPRIVLDRFPENRGACFAMNHCLTKARGEFIAVLNSDDLFLPHKLARQVAFLEEHPEISAVFGRPVFIDERGEPFNDATHKDHSAFLATNTTRAGWLRRFFDHGNCLCHPTVMIRASAYRETGFYDARLAQVPDFDYWVRLGVKHTLHVLDEPLTAFRVRDNLQNASAARPEVVIRDAWERSRVLQHFRQLAPALFGEVFPEYDPAEESREWWLGQYAVQQGTPFHAAFGLDCLFDSLATCPDDYDRHAEFLRISGATNLFGLRLNGNATPQPCEEPVIPDPGPKTAGLISNMYRLFGKR